MERIESSPLTLSAFDYHHNSHVVTSVHPTETEKNIWTEERGENEGLRDELHNLCSGGEAVRTIKHAKHVARMREMSKETFNPRPVK